MGSKKKKKKAKKLKLKLAAQAAAGARAREDTARVSADAPRREPIPTADHGIRKQPPPLRATILGNRQMLPVPIAMPSAAAIKARRDEKRSEVDGSEPMLSAPDLGYR